jgi:large subunit ribosomal protein L23
MSIFDRFKKIKKEPEKKVKKELKEEKALKAEEPKVEIREKKEEKFDKLPRRVEKKSYSDAWHVLESPHVTEKSGMLADQNHYIFKVSSLANKHQVKKAVQDHYGVAVDRVTVINIPRKARRVGRSQGFKTGYRKAIVKLAPGEKIEIMPR